LITPLSPRSPVHLVDVEVKDCCSGIRARFNALLWTVD
jgi:hypothetical protein